MTTHGVIHPTASENHENANEKSIGGSRDIAKFTINFDDMGTGLIILLSASFNDM